MIGRIIKSARKTRQWCMKHSSSHITLVGMCAIASVKLSCELTKYNINHRIVVTDKHVWVDVNGLVVDVTASQFNGIHTPLIIDNISYDRMCCTPWEIPSSKRYFRNHGHMIKYMRKQGWSDVQLPIIN